MMSIFGSLMRDFDADPFFSSQLEAMRRMETMMDSMMAPFEDMMGMGMGMGMPRLTAAVPQRRDQNALRPFGFGRSLFPTMPGVFDNMQTQLVESPFCHSYSSSSVMTYTTDEMGRPQVYQATSSTRTAPGGVKETRNSLQDSRSGVQKMAIGHHLGERAHIIEKEQNRYTGEANENQEFINVEEEEADTFNNEWQQRANPPAYQMAANQRPALYDNQTVPQIPPASNLPKLQAIMPGPSLQPEEPMEQVRKIRSHSNSRRHENGESGSGRQHKRRSGKSKHHDKSKQSWPRKETSM